MAVSLCLFAFSGHRATWAQASDSGSYDSYEPSLGYDGPTDWNGTAASQVPTGLEPGEPNENPTSDAASVRSELIRERYPNGSVKIERVVIQDEQDNFINHGKWKMWDESGNLMAEGSFRHGEREGTWVRWFKGAEAKIFSTVPYKQFVGPFVSRATFEGGKLHGSWTIYDGKQRKVSEWQYASGLRDGRWTWWYTTGKKMREIDYSDGDIDGSVSDWNPDGRLTVKDTYQKGRKLARKVTYYSGSVKKTEGMYLHARMTPKSEDDWWNCELAPFASEGKDERHGPWTSWYPNGQQKLEGEFAGDVEDGTFTWWHSNGQKASQGSYERGKQIGKWTWWHQSGLKSIQGEYTSAGGPSGSWTWWNEDGKVAQRADFSTGKGHVVDVPLPAAESTPAAQKSVTGRPAPRRR
jgi:antitoxin component YwqK of YwqJK toxin-antitoxin module